MAEYIVAVKTFDNKGIKATTSFYKVKGQSVDKVRTKLVAESKGQNIRITVATKARFKKAVNDFIKMGKNVDEYTKLLKKFEA